MVDMMNLGVGIRHGYLHNEDVNAQANLINQVLREMEQFLDSRELSTLNQVLQTIIQKYSISLNENPIIDIDYEEVNNELIKRFMETKRLSGLSEGTLTFYGDTINLLVKFCKKSLDTITTDDVRGWFDYLMNVKGTKPVTIDNYRRNLSSFYNFCVIEGLIYKSPMGKIKAIKRQKQVKQPFSDDEIVSLRNYLNNDTRRTNLRDKAIFELLLSSGMRVSELISLNINDLNFDDRTAIITGKGNKQRRIFFNATTKYAINEYLNSRDDDNPALFVASMYPHNRLEISGLSRNLREAGKACGVNDVHPHRFRRTFATNLLKKDVPIESIRMFLGHSQIATTQLYVVEDEDEIQYNHKRYVN